LSAQGILLGIETSCDDTAAAVLIDGRLVSDVVGRQVEHAAFGGVVPELASRLHLKLIAPVVAEALQQAGVQAMQLDAVAVTQGPGLLGALIVGDGFAKGLCTALRIPLISVDHLTGHIHSLFLEAEQPRFPFVCLTVSGGHTQLTLVRDYLDYEVLGQTRDDAAGEAFDKVAKLLGLPYPGGPEVDRLAEEGDPNHILLPETSLKGLEFSFSGLKTAVLYHLKRELEADPQYVDRHRADLCAAIRSRIVHTLLDKLFQAAAVYGVGDVAVVGGVSANRLLRREFEGRCASLGLRGFIPSFRFCTDNAAMIARAGWSLWKAGRTTPLRSGVFASGG
jgi:N6-L-threonylcarbamoyladenine synthase